MKLYLCRLLSEAADDIETQDAVEYAIYCGLVKLTFDLQKDKAIIQRELLNITEKFRSAAAENLSNNPLNELIGQLADWK